MTTNAHSLLVFIHTQFTLLLFLKVQKVAKTTKMKKAVEKERKKQTDLASELVLLSNKERLFGSQMNQEDRFNQLEQKIDDLKEVVESFMSCRQCLRKAYKGICNPTPSTPQSSSGAGIKTSGLTPCTSITKPYSEVSASASASASSITNTSSSETTAFSSTGPDPVDDDGETLLDAGVEVEDQATMQYLGDPRFGVQICSMDISRCIATAKTIEKLALNVIEFLVAPEEMPFNNNVWQ
ncbi:uncharacterized protein [Argopecten irradians]|uniref:uncharacterized protein n=1 Tax=Argopecten irradians TaxID=31199 RepID=UPI003723EE9F